MCDTCGCEDKGQVRVYKPGADQSNHHHDSSSPHHHHHGEHAHREIRVEKDVLTKNDLMAERNRGYFEALEILAINMVSSPGSGKTSIIERSIQELGADLNLWVMEGDQQTSNDAERIQKVGGNAIQINTGNGCHLDAHMVNRAVHQIDMKKKSILLIENVGNLVCPAMFDLGEKKRVLIFSVPEGDDKPEKYPDIFHTSDVCIINKIDLLPYVDFDMDKAKQVAKQLNPDMLFFETSAKTGEGMEEWLEWLKAKVGRE